MEQMAYVKHPSLAKLEGKKQTFFLNDLAESVYVTDKTSL
jgi:hypothetical protein